MRPRSPRHRNRIGIRRLAALRNDLAAIAQNGSPLSTRVRVFGDDDISDVARQVNATLTALEESQRHLSDAQRIARLGFWHLDLDTMLASVSPEHVRTAGLALEDGELELPFDDYLDRFVHPEDRDLLRSWADFAKSRAFQDVERDIEYRVIGATGEVRHLLAACRKRSGEDSILFLVAQDVTERRRMQEELMRGALYDPLTGLPNRNLVLDRIRAELDRAYAAPCTLLVLDLDRFGVVNNTLGRDLGDGLLLGIAVRLVGVLPPATTVGRMTHDEFAVVLPQVDIAESDRIAEQIRAMVRTPIPIQGKDLVLTGSVGIATALGSECSAEELVSRAESALLQASAKGGDAVAYFDEERSRQAKERVDLEMDLGKAVSDHQLELHYQPIIHLESGRLAGYEALVRWRHPQRGMLPPLLFIPIAERSGLIHEIGLWVMEEAMRKEAAWQARLGEQAPFMSINLSVRQFRHDDLSDQIKATIERTGVHPEGIKLEITESALSEDPQRVAALLEDLWSTGLRFSLDDFGTGYSSLGYLSRFPVQTLKVDKSFVDELGRDEKKTRITSAIVTLAHTLGMDVVAEGIETEVQRGRLLALGCEYGQGYLFSKPLPEAQAEIFLDRL